ncbi:MAG: hypothetical protein J1F40_10165 [Prevotellaceae bacterium]|nr:hypothetical protein [Prevotellaceae bacterium]
MSKLVLPYAYNNNGELVHIDNATKEDKYTCPNCNAEILLRISKIPAGHKYYKRSHFAHRGNSDNHCSESFLHKLFKEKCVEYISAKIANNDNIYFEWHCEKCDEKHQGNLLKKAVRVVSEFDLGICKPDIALLDKNDKVVIVIEIVVTHKPESEVMQYYKENKIACLQIQVNDFADCDTIEEKISHPDKMNICPNPKCKKCGEIMQHVQMVTMISPCWRCGKEMKIAMISPKNGSCLLDPQYFNDEDMKIARTMGANIRLCYSKTIENSYFANVCEHCNAFVGDFYLPCYFYLPHEAESDYYYKCLNCIYK